MPVCSIVLEIALAFALPLPQEGALDPAAVVGEHFAAGRYRAALEASDAIPDAALRAQWRFHVLYTAGDLPGALRVALGGLDEVPGDVALALNAAQCAVELGDDVTAARIARRLERLANDASAAPHSRRIRELQARVAALVDTGRAAAAARSRARFTALAVLTASVAACGLLALWRSPPARGA